MLQGSDFTYTFIDILHTFNLNLHTQNYAQYLDDKHNSFGHLLQNYYFASQGFEAYFTEKTGFATKVFHPLISQSRFYYMQKNAPSSKVHRP
jgi:hypothetical protein